MTKKVLIIERHPDFEIGGVEKYNHLLGSILLNNYKDVKVDKVCMYQPKSSEAIKTTDNEKYYYLSSRWKCNDTQSLSDLIAFAINSLKFKKMVYKLEKINKYDLIIDCSAIISFKKFFDMNNYLWVQHASLIAILNKGLNIKNIFRFIFGFKNNFLYAKNLVLYNEENLKFLLKYRTNNFNYYCINLCCKIPKINLSENLENLKNRQKIIYFGRIDNESKNIKLINEINHKTNLIDFYGNGDEQWINKLGSSYKGFVNPSISPLPLISKYKYMILMSNQEGFSFSLVQALACGVPIIVRNSFINASFLTNNNQNGFLLAEDSTVDEYAKQIQNIYDLDENKYFELCKNAHNFAYRNLSEEEFTKKWINIFNKYLS